MHLCCQQRRNSQDPPKSPFYGSDRRTTVSPYVPSNCMTKMLGQLGRPTVWPSEACSPAEDVACAASHSDTWFCGKHHEPTGSNGDSHDETMHTQSSTCCVGRGCRSAAGDNGSFAVQLRTAHAWGSGRHVCPCQIVQIPSLWWWGGGPDQIAHPKPMYISMLPLLHHGGVGGRGPTPNHGAPRLHPRPGCARVNFSTNRPLRQPTHKAALADADLFCGVFASSAPPGTHPFQIPGATTVVSNGRVLSHG